jgi:hypothetical protein
VRLKCILTSLLALLLAAGALLPAQQTDSQPAPAGKEKAVPAPPPSAAIVTQANDQTADTLASPPVSTAPPANVVSGNIDFGYRWLVRQNGSFNMYRTLVNLGEGPKFFGAHLSFRPEKYWDRLEIDSTGWGDEPYSSAKIYAARDGYYDLALRYREQHFFDNVPSFANPLLVLGYPISQNGDDYKRRLADLDFNLFPNRRISPFFTYQRSGRSGPGYWPWIGPGNEYLVSTLFSDSSGLFRAGTHLTFSRLQFTLEGGGTRFTDDQSYFFSGFNPGNRRTSLFGTTMFLNTLSQVYGARGNMGFFRVSFKAQPFSWVDFAGQFGFSQASSTIKFSETATGQLVTQATPQTFTGLTSTAPGSALNPRPSGNVSMMLRPWRRLRLVDSYDTTRLHNATGSVFSQTFTGVTGLLGLVVPSTISTVAPALNFVAMDYNRHQLEALYDVAPRVTVRGGWRSEWSQWVQPGDTPGELETQKDQRNVALGGVDFSAPGGLMLNFSTEVGIGAKTLMRASLFDYHKIKVGGRYNVKPWLRVNGKYTRLWNENNRPDINLFSHNHEVSFGLLIAPHNGRRFTFSGDWMYQVYSANIPIILPPFFTPGASAWQQNGSYLGSFVNLNVFRGASLNFGGSMLAVHGTHPTGYCQPRAELMVPLHAHLTWFSNWQYWDYNEKFTAFENFSANLFTTGLRINLGKEQ